MLDRQYYPSTWRLLIYTVPSEPSRKRAFVWRELKKVGAMYLRDGVCVLPEGDRSAEALGKIAAKIEEFGGEPTVVPGVELDAARARRIVESSRQDRDQEYAEVVHEVEGLLRHSHHEATHRDLSLRELGELETDVRKLRVWFEQIRSRDYFRAPGTEHVEALLASCDRALATLREAPIVVAP